MKKIFCSLFLCLVLSSLSFADSKKDEEIIVRLETDAQLLPLYLGGLINEQSGFEQDYLYKLEKVLHFDLNQNGMTQVLKRSSKLDALLGPSPFDNLGNASLWRNSHIYYVMVGKVKGQKLFLRVLSVNNDVIKEIQEIPLTGNLGVDRKALHQAADTFHLALFGKDGIATTRLLYTLRTKATGNKWLSEVWEADYDGENARQVTSGAGYCVTPVYVPPAIGQSAGSFFYVSYLNGQPKIFYSSLKDKLGQRLTPLRGNQFMPAISKQRSLIAFVSDVTGNPDLFVQAFDPENGVKEKPRQIFAAHQAVQGTPSFSPDGQRIAFVSNKDGAARIYVMPIPPPDARLKDIRLKLISKQGKESTAPCWSPDGLHLAYCASLNGVRQIWIYNFDRGTERQLTQGPGNKENPTWAPNSLHLVFNSTNHQESELYLINLNQPQSKKISSGLGEKHYPCWEPKAN